MAENEVVNI